MRLRTTLTLTLVVAAGLVGGRAAAQFRQYVPPGEFEETRDPMQLRLERAMQASRWRAGRFFVDPWFGVRNLSYQDNVRGSGAANPQSDVSATIGAGLRLFRPIGPESTFAAHALPEYVWWQDLSERRRLNGRYGVGLFGNFGRAGVELSASRREDASFFSRQLETRVNTRYDVGLAGLEVEAGAGFSVFAAAELRRMRFLDEDDPQLADLDLLDRNEELLRAGVRFSPAAGLTIGLGVEDSSADFQADVRDRSNSGTSPVLQLGFVGTRFDIAANLAARELEPEPGSIFVPYEEITGRAQLQLTLGGRLRLQLYGNRNLVYSTQPLWVYFDDSAVGLGLLTSLGRPASLRLFVEQGSNDYTAVATGRVDRIDDLDGYGGEIRLSLGRYTLLLGTSRTRYDSNLDQFDREITVIRSSFGLTVGGGSPWG